MDIYDPSASKEIVLTASQLKSIESFLPPGLSLALPTKVSGRHSGAIRKVTSGSGQQSVENLPSMSQLPQGQKSRSSFPSGGTKVRSREFLSLVNKLKKFEKVEPFLYPVDPVALGIPDYPLVITRPMDISTIESNARDGIYETFEQFEADVQLIVDNATRYNPAGHPVHLMALELREHFAQILHARSQGPEIPKPPKEATYDSRAKQLEAKRPKKTPDDTPLAYGEKMALAEMIKSKLPADSLWEICRIVAPGKPEVENINFDLDKLPNKQLRELQAFVLSQVKQRNKKRKEEPFHEDVKEPAPTQTPSNNERPPEAVPVARKSSCSSHWASSSDEY